ncbi:tyrosine-type recombinase/integrase [Streptomyces sp. NPDC059396]|uniref:tyrosine-type recombinase/integrase n=1 Tax=Streptomyces sp. NPDC059396 TaxID=3346819 RepID=UPI0036960877
MQHLRLPASQRWSATTRLLNHHTGHPHTASADTRHSYVTHLTEDGVDRRFIQQQVDHECDSSLAIYTHVSDDFMNTSLHKALAPAFAGA